MSAPSEPTSILRAPAAPDSPLPRIPGAAAGVTLVVVLGAILIFHLLRADHLNRKEVTDLTTFYHAALAYRTGGDPYAIDATRWPYLYPPTLLWMMAPLTLLPYRAAVGVWTAGGFALWMISAFLALRLARPEGARGHPLLIVLPSLLAYRFVLRCSNFGQVDLLVLTFVTVCLALLAAGKHRLAGAALAVATAIKILPGVLALLFLRQDRRRAISGFAAGLLLCLALPAVGPGPDRALELVRQWRGSAIWQHASDWSMANEASNQSLSATLNRLLVGHDESHTSPAGSAGLPLANLGLEVSRRLWMLLAAILGLATAAAVLTPRAPAFLPLEASALLLFMHLVSRKTWETHLVTLVLVYTALLAAAIRGPSHRRLLGGGAVAAALLQNFYAPLFVGSASDAIQSWGPTTLSLLLLWSAAIRVLAVERSDVRIPVPVPVLCLILLWICFSGLRAYRESLHLANDFSTYYLRSADVSAGLDPYRLTEGQAPYIYPPLLLWLFTPLTFLPVPFAAVVWSLLTVASTLAIATRSRPSTAAEKAPGALSAAAEMTPGAFSSTAAESTPGAFSATPAESTPGAFWAFLPFALSFRFVMREISQGQVNALVVAITVAALAALVARRDALSGALLGFATGLKILPAVFLMPLVLWRRWRAAAAMLVVIPVTLLLPVLGWGPGTTARVIDQWRGGQFLAHASDPDLDVQAQNVSLWAWCRRTFSEAPATPPGKPPRFANITAFSPETATRIYLLLALILLSCAVRALARVEGPEAMAAGWALCWNLVHLVSKKSWEEHLVSLILILSVLVAAPARPAVRRRAWGWVIPAILIWCHAPLFVGADLADTIQLFSPTTFALVVTFLALLLRLEDLARPTPAEGTP